MSREYLSDPVEIEHESFRRIRRVTDLDGLGRVQQQVAMRVVHSLGEPGIAGELRFSERACDMGCAALRDSCTILCDVEMVCQGITRRLLSKPPLCFLNDESVSRRAREHAQTRSMVALDLWRELLPGSVVLIGNAPSALFRLLEMLEGDAGVPALVIAMPVGFVGAQESKQLLWERHRELGVECITLPGRKGGSAPTAASCNALLRCNHGEWY